MRCLSCLQEVVRFCKRVLRMLPKLSNTLGLFVLLLPAGLELAVCRRELLLERAFGRMSK
jgi:hypothetical protein